MITIITTMFILVLFVLVVVIAIVVVVVIVALTVSAADDSEHRFKNNPCVVGLRISRHCGHYNTTVVDVHHVNG